MTTEKNPSTARSDKRRAELAAIAQKYGFKSWSAMLTAIKNGNAKVVAFSPDIKMVSTSIPFHSNEHYIYTEH